MDMKTYREKYEEILGKKYKKIEKFIIDTDGYLIGVISKGKLVEFSQVATQDYFEQMGNL